eukprot:CAMPEP_0173267500 /NCGR_PEP_ID=MMETSP1142-20121109/29799_1 /TAXON_ID=483371 /ORGANISM="non described non described, Strain CCMP2298" /LENGTH=44 /DNA_ID= /DNA_START= /DNA_END= /DNA_ORIENTATION=
MSQAVPGTQRLPLRQLRSSARAHHDGDQLGPGQNGLHLGAEQPL